MMKNHDQKSVLNILQTRLSTILPEQYQDSCAEVQPVSMGSAGLKFSSDGAVAWNEIWATFCDLAMAGGPPHKGALLEPGSSTEIQANPGGYQQVANEICRGISLVTGLDASLSDLPGWVEVGCSDFAMAEWLTRAIVMENVSVRCDGAVLQLPAGPGYRLDKEIKNVITVIAKTCHYWRDHVSWPRKRAIENLFAEMEMDSPLLQPAVAGYGFRLHENQALFDAMADSIRRTTGLEVSNPRYAGWLGVECRRVAAAIWMMRGMVVSNVLSRREGTVLFVPVNPVTDPDGKIVLETLAQIQSLAASEGMI